MANWPASGRWCGFRQNNSFRLAVPAREKTVADPRPLAQGAADRRKASDFHANDVCQPRPFIPRRGFTELESECGAGTHGEGHSDRGRAGSRVLHPDRAQ